MTFTPLFLSELNASVIGTPCDSQDLFILRSLIHSIVTVVLFWMVWLLVFQLYGQLYADDEIYMGVLLYVCAGQLAASGKAGIIMEAQPSQQPLTLDFSTAVTNKGPTQPLVDGDHWGHRKAAGFYLCRSQLFRGWHSLPSTRLSAAWLSKWLCGWKSPSSGQPGLAASMHQSQQQQQQ